MPRLTHHAYKFFGPHQSITLTDEQRAQGFTSKTAFLLSNPACLALYAPIGESASHMGWAEIDPNAALKALERFVIIEGLFGNGEEGKRFTTDVMAIRRTAMKEGRYYKDRGQFNVRLKNHLSPLIVHAPLEGVADQLNEQRIDFNYEELKQGLIVRLRPF